MSFPLVQVARIDLGDVWLVQVALMDMAAVALVQVAPIEGDTLQKNFLHRSHGKMGLSRPFRSKSCQPP